MTMKESLWIERLEAAIAARTRRVGTAAAWARLLVLLPILILALKQVGALPARPGLLVPLVVVYGILSYLEDVRRPPAPASLAHRLLAGVSDLLLWCVVLACCRGLVSTPLLIAKAAIEVLLLALVTGGRNSGSTRIQDGLQLTTFLGLLFMSQGLLSGMVTPQAVTYLLWLDVIMLGTIALINLRILQKRFIADALSGCNLTCGAFSMVFAARGQLPASLLFLMLGAGFDGFDGAAARKFGGTRWGVYSDDIADGVNYGIAPGVALYLVIGGFEGAVLGSFFTVFTLSRLVFFTLSKGGGDPEFFCGVPSTVGALVTICSMILFADHVAVIGLMVGIACIQMVSFDTHYRHLGRALASNRRILYGMPVFLVVVLSGRHFIGPQAPIALVLGASLIYGFLPTVAHFREVLRGRSA